MKWFKGSIVAALALSALALAFPAGVLAASHHPGTEVGTISAYTAGSSVTVNGQLITLDKHTKLVSEDGSAAPTVGDSAVAFVRWHKHTAIAKKLEFGATAFAYMRHDFSGRYKTSTATLLSITVRKSVLNFTTDSHTKYYDNGHAVTVPSYIANERVTVRAEAFTDGTWYAAVVRLQHGLKKGH
jgi:hypothetical protein